MPIGINYGLSGTIAASKLYDNDYPNEGQDNPVEPWKDNYKILQVGIENLQTKHIEVTGDITGISDSLEAGTGNVLINLTYANPPIAKAGDTMQGALTLFQDPTNNLHATTKQYVDQEILDAMASFGTISGLDDKLDMITGGTMTVSFDMQGNRITTVGNALIGTDALNKQTADNLYMTNGGGTITGNISLALALTPTNPEHLINKGYVDTELSNLIGSAPGILDTLEEIATSLGNDANIASTIAGKVAKTGDTMTGPLVLSADPSLTLGAATKRYVDTAITTHSHIDLLPLSGGTMTGPITDVNILNDLVVEGIIRSEGTSTDVDITIIPQGIGQVMVASGYEVRAGESLTTKSYVDLEISNVSGLSGLGQKLDKAGDTMTGHLTMTPGSKIFTDMVQATGTGTDVDLIITGKGSGIVIASSGYDMSTGPSNAFVTKGFMNTEIADQVAARVLAVKNHAEPTDDITINNKHQLIVYGEYIVETGGIMTIDAGAALVVL